MPSFTSKGTKGLPSVAMSSKVWSSTDIRRGQNKKPALTIRKRYRKPAWTLKTALGSVKTPVGSSARPDKINKRVETKQSKKKVFFTRKKSKGSLPTFSVRKKTLYVRAVPISYPSLLYLSQPFIESSIHFPQLSRQGEVCCSTRVSNLRASVWMPALGYPLPIWISA